MMRDQSHRQSAEIIAFPARGKLAGLTPGQMRLALLEMESRQFPAADHHAWYHEDAMSAENGRQSH